MHPSSCHTHFVFTQSILFLQFQFVSLLVYSFRCDKRKAPNICDLEFDVFIQSHVPKEQLVVVMVLSSM